MAFRYSDRNREEYLRDGFTILRGLIPPSLLTDLRRQSETARQIARRLHGPSAQRLQPVYAHPEIDPRPFRDFLALEGLRDTVREVLSPEHGQTDIMGILLEPQEKAWCTHWHRDWGYNIPDIDLDDFFAHFANPRMFNQINAPLYDDHSLWAVPGSDARRDTPEETAAFARIPPPGPELTDAMDDAARERVCADYCRAMPGASPVLLLAGDCAFYRATMWHLGTYVPYVRRATLHDGFYGPEDRAWQAKVFARRAAAAASP